MDYILSHQSVSTQFHIPDWNDEDTFLVGAFLGMGYLKNID